MELTLSIIKPDAVAGHHIGAIFSRFEQAGLHIIAAKMVHLTQNQAETFYDIHSEKPFFQELVAFISSGPIMISVLQGVDAIAVNRQLMGATDPKRADPGTIRADFGESIDANVVHGSDGPETARREIAMFFAGMNLFTHV